MAGRRTKKKRKIKEIKGPAAFTIFVDASLKGWGAVIVDMITNETFIHGEAWSSFYKGRHINELEAQALFCAVKLLPGRSVAKKVHVLVDNTTVVGVTRKQQCVKSRLLNDSIIGALQILRENHNTFSMQWVQSEDNPADLPSRIIPVKMTSEKCAAGGTSSEVIF